MNVIARYTYKSGKEDRILSVVDTLDFEALRQIKPAIGPGHIVLTDKELEGSTDVFPLEILTMKTTGNLVEGKHVLSDLKVSKKDVRRQLEFEFRSKVIHLREAFFGAKEKDLVQVLSRVTPVLAPIIEGMLFLKGEVEEEIDAALDKVQKLFNIDVSLLKKLEEPVKKSEAESYLKQVYELLLRLSDKLDRMKV